MAYLYSNSGRFGGGIQNPLYGINAQNTLSMLKPYWDWLSQNQAKMGGSGSLSPWAKGLVDQGTGNAPTMSAADSVVNPLDVIKAQLPAINEQRDLGFADAARKFGSLGMLASGGNNTGYTSALGQQARGAASDIAGLYWNVMGQHAEQQAARQQEANRVNAQMALEQMGNKLQAGMQLGGWDVNAALSGGQNINELFQQLLGAQIGANDRGANWQRQDWLTEQNQTREDQLRKLGWGREDALSNLNWQRQNTTANQDWQRQMEMWNLQQQQANQNLQRGDWNSMNQFWSQMYGGQ